MEFEKRWFWWKFNLQKPAVWVNCGRIGWLSLRNVDSPHVWKENFHFKTYLLEVCNNGIHVWTVYDWQPAKNGAERQFSFTDATLISTSIHAELSFFLSFYAPFLLFPFVTQLIVLTVRKYGCKDNVTIPARGVHIIRDVLCLRGIPERRFKKK